LGAPVVMLAADGEHHLRNPHTHQVMMTKKHVGRKNMIGK